LESWLSVLAVESVTNLAIFLQINRLTTRISQANLVLYHRSIKFQRIILLPEVYPLCHWPRNGLSFAYGRHWIRFPSLFGIFIVYFASKGGCLTLDKLMQLHDVVLLHITHKMQVLTLWFACLLFHPSEKRNYG